MRLLPVPTVDRIVQPRPKDPNVARKKFGYGFAGGGYVRMGKRIRHRCAPRVLESAVRGFGLTDLEAVPRQPMPGARQAIGAM